MSVAEGIAGSQTSPLIYFPGNIACSPRFSFVDFSLSLPSSSTLLIGGFLLLLLFLFGSGSSIYRMKAQTLASWLVCSLGAALAAAYGANTSFDPQKAASRQLSFWQED